MKKVFLTASLILSLLIFMSFGVQAHYDPNMPEHTHDGTPPPPPPEGRQEGIPPGQPGQTNPGMQGERPLPPPRNVTIVEHGDDVMNRREGKQQIQDMKMEVKEGKRPPMKMEVKMKPEEIKKGIQKMREEVKEASQEMKQESVEERCENVTARIETITSDFNMGIGGRIKAFKAISARYQKLSGNLEEKGSDVTQLNTVLTTLDTKIATLETDYAAFISELEGTKEYACGESNGAFKTANEEATTAFRQVQKDKMEIEQYLRTTVRSTLMALKKTISVAPTVPVEPTSIQ